MVAVDNCKYFVRADIGIVFQNPVLLPWRTVLQNTMLPVAVQRLDRAKYLPRARALYVRACGQNYAQACSELGIMFLNGEGGPGPDSKPF